MKLKKYRGHLKMAPIPAASFEDSQSQSSMASEKETDPGVLNQIWSLAN
jgi:hypothetical protein